MIMIEHVMDLVREVADRVVVLNYGAKIAEGSFAEIEADPKSSRPIWERGPVHARRKQLEGLLWQGPGPVWPILYPAPAPWWPPGGQWRRENDYLNGYFRAVAGNLLTPGSSLTEVPSKILGPRKSSPGESSTSPGPGHFPGLTVRENLAGRLPADGQTGR